MSMYEVVKARVRVNGSVTEAFECSRRLKQGENCSPILFSLLINELANEVEQHEKHGLTLSPYLIQILIMLFAYDVLLISNTVVGLQQQLNILRNAAHKLNLLVNREKSKINIFRKGRHVAAREKWLYDGIRLEVVNQYKYLGVVFSTGLTFLYPLADMAKRARKGVFGILKLLWTLGENCPKLFFKRFDCQIQPMLTYGAEAWGLIADHTVIERVHLFAVKRLLIISAKTPSALVYGEAGRHPLYIQTYTKCIKYRLKVTRMTEDRIPFKAYKMLCILHCKDKNNWVSNVCFTLYKYGFGHVWENQGVENVSHFLRAFKQRLVDCFLQDWNSSIMSSDRYAFYSSFKQLHELTPYLTTVKNPVIRKALTRIRLGVSALRPHQCKYSKVPVNLDYPFCKETRESEMHFILSCPKYSTLRKSFIPAKYYVHPNALKLSLLLADGKKIKIKNKCTSLALYLSKAFHVRNQSLQA